MHMRTTLIIDEALLQHTRELGGIQASPLGIAIQ